MDKNKSRWKTWHKVVIGVIVGFFLLMIIAVNSEPEQTQLKTEAEIKAEEKVSREEYFQKNGLFSAWDGRPVALVELIKKSMNDPNSFEHLETRFIDKGTDTITVLMDYTGKNAFGGRVRGKAIAVMNAKDGSVIEVISNE